MKKLDVKEIKRIQKKKKEVERYIRQVSGWRNEGGLSSLNGTNFNEGEKG